MGAAWGGGPVVSPLSPGGREHIVISLSLGPTAQAGGDQEWAPEDERREAGQGGGGFSLGKKQGGCPQAGAGCAGRGSQTRHLASQGGGQGWGPHCPSARPVACRSGHQVQWQGLHAEVCCRVCEQEHAPRTRLPPNESQVGPHLACRAAPPALIRNEGLSVPRTSAVPHSL